jgi:hypothetical protein
MAHKFAAAQGLTPEQIALFRWRGEGWPGMTHIESTDGRVFEIDYDTAWFDPTVPWTYDMQFRCKICPDAIGEAADVSCPDGWVMEDGKPIHREAPGVNVAVPRTAAGRRLIAEAAAAGDIHFEPFTLAELDLMHAITTSASSGARAVCWASSSPACRGAGSGATACWPRCCAPASPSPGASSSAPSAGSAAAPIGSSLTLALSRGPSGSGTVSAGNSGSHSRLLSGPLSLPSWPGLSRATTQARDRFRMIPDDRSEKAGVECRRAVDARDKARPHDG